MKGDQKEVVENQESAHNGKEKEKEVDFPYENMFSALHYLSSLHRYNNEVPFNSVNTTF